MKRAPNASQSRLRPGPYMYQQPPTPIESHTSQLLVLPSLSDHGGQGQVVLSGFPAQKDSLQ